MRMPRLTRYTLGIKIDNLFTDAIEFTLRASYTPREQKYHLLQQVSEKLDFLKFFLKTAWELKALNHQQYSTISYALEELGKMVGGWLHYAKK